MITVSTIELFLKSAELLSAGYQRVELLECERNEGSPAFLSFEAIDEDSDSLIEYETIPDRLDDDSVSIRFSPDSIAPYTMTLNDLALTSHAFHNAIENCKVSLDDKSLSADLRSQAVSSMKRFESYVKKLDSFLDGFSAVN